MKKTILAFAASLLITGAMLTGCYSSGEKVENAEENVAEANKALDEANKEYLADIENYKKMTADKIKANNKNIAEFNQRIAKEKKEVKADYQKKIAELEQKNTDMQLKIDSYKAAGKDNWELFKAEFSRDMDAIGDALKDLTNG
jgi:uncharacterized protein HemX